MLRNPNTHTHSNTHKHTLNIHPSSLFLSIPGTLAIPNKQWRWRRKDLTALQSPFIFTTFLAISSSWSIRSTKFSKIFEKIFIYTCLYVCMFVCIHVCGWLFFSCDHKFNGDTLDTKSVERFCAGIVEVALECRFALIWYMGFQYMEENWNP